MSDTKRRFYQDLIKQVRDLDPGCFQEFAEKEDILSLVKMARQAIPLHVDHFLDALVAAGINLPKDTWLHADSSTQLGGFYDKSMYNYLIAEMWDSDIASPSWTEVFVSDEKWAYELQSELYIQDYALAWWKPKSGQWFFNIGSLPGVDLWPHGGALWLNVNNIDKSY